MSRHHFVRPALACLIPLTALLSGCASRGTQRHATSVVSYLYGDAQQVAQTPSVPVLRLPIRLGIAFVPPSPTRGRESVAAFDLLPESDRQALMRTIADRFRAEAIIKSVELIPTSYLTPGGGFENLDQLRNMFGIDVIALIAYDQVQFHHEGKSSIAYWTIVGAYVIEGEKNDTRTLMDAVVVDIASRKMLFRAPGTSVVRGSAAPVDLAGEQRRDRIKGFQLAARELNAGLEQQLAAFKERVKSAPEEVRVVRSPEYDRRAAASGSGAGAVDGAGLLVLLMLSAGAWGAARAPKR